MKPRKLLTILIISIVPLFFSKPVEAAGADFSLRPSSGYVALGEEFKVDLLIDSGTDEIMLARVVLAYDPRVIEVKNVERNDSLFCDWPEDEQTVDQDNGVIIISGFCQSGAGNLYQTASAPDVLARITFEPKKVGSTPLEFEWSGEDEPYNSVLMADGSPPQNVLLSQPRPGDFTVVGSIDGSPSGGDDDSNPGGGETPATSIMIFESRSFAVGVIILALSGLTILGSYFVIQYIKIRGKKLYRTNVLENEEDFEEEA